MSTTEEKIYSLFRAARCHNCDIKLPAGQLAKVHSGNGDHDDRDVRCLACAGLAEFVLLPSGNAKATKLAKKYSSRHFVVHRWSELWKSYERVGLLVELQAARQVESELGLELT